MTFDFVVSAMAKTNRERQAEFRARNKSDHDSYAEYKRKDARRKALTRSADNMTESEYTYYRQRENERFGKYRQKKRDSAPIRQPAFCVKMPFKSRQSAGKALKKAFSSLPKSPRKRAHVATEIARESGLVLSASKQAGSKNSIDDKLKKAVINFYCADETSWQAPGRKDQAIIRWKYEKGTKLKSSLQTRFMLSSLSEAHQQFLKQSQENTKIGLSKFCDLRPKHIKLFDKIPHNVCVCKTMKTSDCSFMRYITIIFRKVPQDLQIHWYVTHIPKAACILNAENTRITLINTNQIDFLTLLTNINSGRGMMLM